MEKNLTCNDCYFFKRKFLSIKKECRNKNYPYKMLLKMKHKNSIACDWFKYKNKEIK